MKKVLSIEQGVSRMLSILEIEADWKYVPAKDTELFDKLILDGVEYPLLWWRYAPQSNLLKRYADPLVPLTCKMNLSSHRSKGLDSALFREFDSAEFYLNSKIKELQCFINGSTALVIATMDNENVATLEVGATLEDGFEEQGHHIVWGKEGHVSDRVASEKNKQHSMYLYMDGADPETYSDNCLNLFGLDKMGCDKVTAIIGMIREKDRLEILIKQARRCEKYVRLAHQSNENQKKVLVVD